MERNNLFLEEKDIILKDAVNSKEKRIPKNKVKGFSTTTYNTRAWNFKSLILYLANGDKIEFPQFLYWNFKDFKVALEENNIQYLGHEPYRWKWFDKRHYQYD